jgi:hypothetical protein
VVGGLGLGLAVGGFGLAWTLRLWPHR